MRLRNMLKICLVFWESEPKYAYKRYAYKKKTCSDFSNLEGTNFKIFLILIPFTNSLPSDLGQIMIFALLSVLK